MAKVIVFRTDNWEDDDTDDHSNSTFYLWKNRS